MTTSRNIQSSGTIRTTRRLYEAVVEHHNNCLQMLFLSHYQSLSDGTQDRLWIRRLQPYLKHQIRLHLCVVRRDDIFDWTDKEVGTKILRLYNLI